MSVRRPHLVTWRMRPSVNRRPYPSGKAIGIGIGIEFMLQLPIESSRGDGLKVGPHIPAAKSLTHRTFAQSAQFDWAIIAISDELVTAVDFLNANFAGRQFQDNL